MKKHNPAPEERHCFTRTDKGSLKVALAFPNTYYIGMSNMGFQTLYRILNSRPDVLCERVFLPEPQHIPALQASRRSLATFENGRPLRSFHIIAFSISFENDYINILSILQLAGIPLLRSQRRDSHPLIIGGGISVFLNPEPLADIFDLFIIGEAEEVLDEVMTLVTHGHPGKKWKRPPLELFAGIQGVYIPSGYTVYYHVNGLIRNMTPAQGFPGTILPRKVKNLNAFPATSCVRTPHTEFADMLLVEISRGCPRSCRFCAVGSVYRPYRPRSFAHIREELEPALRERVKIGVLGSAVCDHPALSDILRFITAAGSPVSISSMRADMLTEELVRLLRQSSLKTFTIAPEAGTERLRRIIRKELTDQDIMQAVRVLSRCRISHIKLYFMIGLPGECEEDVKSIVTLVKKIKHSYYTEAKSEKWLHHITLSITPFVPKPFTAFQWHPFDPVKNLKQKARIITGGLKKESKVAVTYDLPKWGYLQTLLSRGDRRVARILTRVLEYQGNWTQAIRGSDVNPDFYVYRERSLEEVLPWDIIDHGIPKAHLWREYQNACAQKT